MTRPESLFHGRDKELLPVLLDFYARPAARILDCTANRRRMWQGIVWAPSPVFLDLDPTMAPDVVGDFRALPFGDASFDVLVFDPPHLPKAAASARSDPDFAKRFGLGFAPAADNVSGYFAPFLREAARVLAPDGVILAKLKDFTHNHAYQWTLVEWVQAVRAQPGLTPCDLLIKKDPSAGNLKSGRWKKAHHARNVHCWWTVTRKGRCEPRGA